MDINQTQNGEPKAESKPKLQLPALKKKYYLPKFKLPNLREKFAEYRRVLKVTKKPSSEEFKAIVKASGLGIAVIGFVGFIIAMIVQLTKLS